MAGRTSRLCPSRHFAHVGEPIPDTPPQAHRARAHPRGKVAIAASNTHSSWTFWPIPGASDRADMPAPGKGGHGRSGEWRCAAPSNGTG